MECLKICVSDVVGAKEKKKNIVTLYVTRYISNLINRDVFIIPTACSPPNEIIDSSLNMARQAHLVESLCF